MLLPSDSLKIERQAWTASFNTFGIPDAIASPSERTI